MKICSSCKIEKPLSEYHKRNNRPCGVRSICKSCYKEYPKKQRKDYMREYDLMKSYSITKNDYEALLKQQDNKCKICGSEPPSIGKKKYLCVDHDHKTGKIRGLLCDKCNRGIGLLNDDYKIIQNALNYILNK
jgi:hypothetical protein